MSSSRQQVRDGSELDKCIDSGGPEPEPCPPSVKPAYFTITNVGNSKLVTSFSTSQLIDDRPLGAYELIKNAQGDVDDSQKVRARA